MRFARVTCQNHKKRPRPDSLHPFKQQTNYDFAVLKLDELPIHARELYRYWVDEVLDDFITVRWSETPVFSLSNVRFDGEISNQICLSVPNKGLLNYVQLDKHIFESSQIYFLNRWKRITHAGLRIDANVGLQRKYINLLFARCSYFYGAGAVTKHRNDERITRCANQVTGPD